MIFQTCEVIVTAHGCVDDAFIGAEDVNILHRGIPHIGLRIKRVAGCSDCNVSVMRVILINNHIVAAIDKTMLGKRLPRIITERNTVA